MRDKRKTLDKKRKNLKFKKIAKKQKLQERGITLIALVVTIIILLILSGVTLKIALSDNGLFSKTKKATEDYKEAQSDEEEAIRQIATQMYSEYVGAKVTGYTPVVKSCIIEKITSGTSSEQTFKTNQEMQWRVWDFDGNILRIVGDPTTEKLVLKGMAGYNNGVWAIEEICKKCYSNEKEGVTVTSLKRTDIQKVSSYDYTQYKHGKDSQSEVTDESKEDKELIHFGESKSDYTDENKKYPKMWNDNDKNWAYGYDSTNKAKTGSDQECKIWETAGKGNGKIQEEEMTKSTSGIIFKQSSYSHQYIKEEFDNEKYFDLIFKNSNQEPTHLYWLAGRSTYLLENYCRFAIQRVNSDEEGRANVGANTVCDSNGGEKMSEGGNNFFIRPIISIDLRKSGCTLTDRKGQDGNIDSCALSFASE